MLVILTQVPMCYAMFKHCKENQLVGLSVYRLRFDVVMMLYVIVVDFVESVMESEANYSKVFLLPIFYSF